MFPFVSAQLLREISLLSNPSKTPALGKASVSKAEPSTAAFETRRKKYPLDISLGMHGKRKRGCVQTYFAQERPRTNQKNIPPIPANPFTIGINGFIVFMIMPIYTQIRHLRKDGLHD